MKTNWTKSKFSKTDLHNKSVEYQIPTPDGIHTGVGVFLVRQNLKGQLGIEVVEDTPVKNQPHRRQTIYPLTQAAVDRIAKHSESSVAEFRLALAKMYMDANG